MKNKSTVKYVVSSFAWSTITKLLDAGLKFVTIPILLIHFGKGDYGLLTLAVAANAYMALLNMGLNTGAVKFFSQWLANKNYDLLHRVARTNLTFYLSIGVINCIVLVLLAFNAEAVFAITPDQSETFKYLLLVLAVFSIVNWTIFVCNQLLIADEKIQFTQQILAVRSVIDFLFILFIVYVAKGSLIQYLFGHLLINALVIVPYIYVCKKQHLINSFTPAFYWKDFSIVFKYSLAIFAMSVFQFTATQSRPLILGIFGDGVNILAEYRIIEVFPLFIISIGGMLISILLPKTSKAVQNNDKPAIEKMAYEGTKYTSILVSLLCFPIMLCAKEILTLYVGVEYEHLWMWLLLWVFTIVLFLHSTPVSSLILATGKTKMLVYSAAIACILSMIINAILTRYFGVGSAVIGYLVYIIIQMSFYYFYFNSKVLGLQSMRIFKSFIVPTAIGFMLFLGLFFLDITVKSTFLQIAINAGLWVLLYILCLLLFKVVNFQSLKTMIKPHNSTSAM